MTWRPDMPYEPEWTKIVWELVPYTRGRGIDLGCGTTTAFPHFIGVDNLKEKGIFNDAKVRPDVTCDADKLDIFADASLDFVFSSHLLEHMDDWKAALRLWWSKIKVGGNLVLYLPLQGAYPDVGTSGANIDHKTNFKPGDVIAEMKGVGSWDLLRTEERVEGDEYSFLQVFKKLKKGAGHEFAYLAPKPEGKTCAVVRYGAWGDGLQASSVLPELKKQGYHITFYTTPRCQEVLKHDPNIDAWYIQDVDQVPNNFLGPFWEHEKTKYDKWVNLSGSVEGAWLPAEKVDILWHSFPHQVRKKYLDANYSEFAHTVADVPYTKPLIKFYPTLEERNWAFEQKKQIGGDPLILWVLAGSSIHKVWPHIDTVLARIFLEYPKARVVSVGNDRDKMIEDTPPGTPGAQLNWHAEKRIIRRAGQWSIRETLAFAQLADLVIGPETGVLSSVSMEKVPKIVFLSHSSHNNLTRDWLNTFALFSTITPCYPCHQLHYSWKNCHESKQIPGAAECQFDIPADACWMAVKRALGNLQANRNPKLLSIPIKVAHAG